MTNLVDITERRVKEERGGSVLVNFSYTVTDGLGNKRAGSGSFAVSDKSAVDSQIRATLQNKLGYKSFDITPYEEIVPHETPVKRGPGRPPKVA